MIDKRHLEILRERWTPVVRLSEADAGELFWLLTKATPDDLDTLENSGIEPLAGVAKQFRKIPLRPSEVDRAANGPDSGRLTWRRDESGRIAFMLHPNRPHALACVSGANHAGWRMVIPAPFPR